MSTMNVSLPDELKPYVDDQVGGGAYGSTSEYMRDPIRRDMDRQLRSRAAATLSGPSITISFALTSGASCILAATSLPR